LLSERRRDLRGPHSFPTRRSSDLVASCAGVRMKVPEAALGSPPWLVTGYSERSMGDGELTIDSARVLDVKRRTAPIKPQNRKARSEEHTSELQSRENLVCRLLLEK